MVECSICGETDGHTDADHISAVENISKRLDEKKNPFLSEIVIQISDTRKDTFDLRFKYLVLKCLAMMLWHDAQFTDKLDAPGYLKVREELGKLIRIYSSMSGDSID